MATSLWVLAACGHSCSPQRSCATGLLPSARRALELSLASPAHVKRSQLSLWRDAGGLLSSPANRDDD